MAWGNSIIVTADPQGQFVEGIINAAETPKPGTIMQIDPTQSRQGNRHVWKAYTRDADGDRPKGPYIVLLADEYQGRTKDDAYAAGERAFGYIPQEGDELNLLYKNVTGTADDVAAGDLFIIDSGTGKLIVTTGSPENEVAMALESYTDPTADRHLWCQWTGA